MSHAVSGGPGELPPEPGAKVPGSGAVASKVVRYLIAIVFFMIMAVAVLVIYLVTSNSGTTGGQTLQPLPSIPAGLPQLTTKQACLVMKPTMATGEQIKAAAIADLKAGQTELPSVDQAELTTLLTRLQFLRAQAPKPLAAPIEAYGNFYLQLRELKSGAETGEADSAESTRAAASVKTICR